MNRSNSCLLSSSVSFVVKGLINDALLPERFKNILLEIFGFKICLRRDETVFNTFFGLLFFFEIGERDLSDVGE